MWALRGVLDKESMHIGQEIQKTIASQGMSVVTFARCVPTSRVNVYRIFKKDNIDIKLLLRICVVLNHDFFKDISDSNAVGRFSEIRK